MLKFYLLEVTLGESKIRTKRPSAKFGVEKSAPDKTIWPKQAAQNDSIVAMLIFRNMKIRAGTNVIFKQILSLRDFFLFELWILVADLFLDFWRQDPIKVWILLK